MQEFLTICNCKQYFGAALTPRHQGPGERAHREVMSQWLILIHKVAGAYPQEWDVLAPAIEYYMDTAIGETEFSAHEIQTGYALLEEPDRHLAPFMVPRGTPQTDIAARRFMNFSHLYTMLLEHKEEARRTRPKMDTPIKICPQGYFGSRSGPA